MLPAAAQSTPSTISLIFVPIRVPSSCQSPALKADFSASTKPARALSICRSSNCTPPPEPPEPPPPPPESSSSADSTFSSSKPISWRFSSFTSPEAWDAEDPTPSMLPETRRAATYVDEPVSRAKNWLMRLNSPTNLSVTNSMAGASALSIGAAMAARLLRRYTALPASDCRVPAKDRHHVRLQAYRFFMPERSPSTTLRVSMSPDSTPRTAVPICKKQRFARCSPVRSPRTLPFMFSTADCMTPTLR